MPGRHRAATDSREARGYSSPCAHSHHADCGLEACTCPCHTDPEYLTKTPAQRAHVARRAQAAGGAARETGEVAPNRPTVKPGVKPPITAAAARQLKSEFSLLLYGADQAAAKLTPKYWTTPEDRLQDDERTNLVNSSYAVMEAYCPELLRILAKVSESAPLATFVYTVATVAAPRLAHHGVIPAELASAIVFAPLIFAQHAAAEPAGEPAAAVDPIGARVADRPDWDGQVDASGVPVAVPTVQGGVPEQAGYGPVRHGADHQNGAGAR